MSKEGRRGEEWGVRENTNWKQKFEWENAISESSLFNSVFKVVPRSCPNKIMSDSRTWHCQTPLM